MHAQYVAIAASHEDADFDAKLMAFMRLVLDDSFHFRRVYAVDLVLVVILLWMSAMIYV